MIESIGQDVTNHLHEPGGPLASEPERVCTECGGAIEEGRFHAIGDARPCDQCAPGHALRVIQSTSNPFELQEALDVLRQIAREFEAGEWRRT
jgi:hypothetical protein